MESNSTNTTLTLLAGQMVLAVDCDLLLEPEGPFPLRGARHCHLTELDTDLLGLTAASCVILPLFTLGYDAMTAVELLEDLGYGGRIVVLAPPLPKPAVVEQELRQMGPGTRLILISTR
ncbi:MAG: hypothetical protein H7317_17365 [Pseudorhodobacter sp.]|nr:hypothetical protein [Pseudorhodobacter sp.]